MNDSAPVLAALASLALVASGCSSPHPVSEPPEPVAFTAEPDGDGAAVVLRGRTDGARLQVDVVARRATNVQGASFRLQWDPAALAFVEVASGPGWSKDVFARARAPETARGQLAVVWTETGGTRAIDASEDTVLGTVTFRRLDTKGTKLAFVRDRSVLVDKSGANVPVTWRGGTLVATSPRQP